LAAAVPLHAQIALAGYLDLDLVALLETEQLDHSLRQANRQAIPPFSNLHGTYSPDDIRKNMYIIPGRQADRSTERAARLSPARVTSLGKRHRPPDPRPSRHSSVFLLPARAPRRGLRPWSGRGQT